MPRASAAVDSAAADDQRVSRKAVEAYLLEQIRLRGAAVVGEPGLCLSKADRGVVDARVRGACELFAPPYARGRASLLRRVPQAQWMLGIAAHLVVPAADPFLPVLGTMPRRRARWLQT